LTTSDIGDILNARLPQLLLLTPPPPPCCDGQAQRVESGNDAVVRRMRKAAKCRNWRFTELIETTLE
jgi:hypothetical protein